MTPTNTKIKDTISVILTKVVETCVFSGVTMNLILFKAINITEKEEKNTKAD